jgi:tyrosyl-tRNA synthetase
VTATARPTRPAEGLPGLLDELDWRGMLHAATPGLADRLATGRPIAGYNGFDPSGPSLHIGNLVPIFGLLHFQRRGGRPVALVGGGTGMIGDPSGRSSERNLLDEETLRANAERIHAQLEPFLDFSAGSNPALMVNNLDWLGGYGLIEFLRDVGKHFTIPYMLAKDSVQGRLDRGLSYTEFSYMLLQAADFRHLYRTMGVELQMGGADQWGNITAGLELIRRTEGEHGGGEADPDHAHGLCYPLLTLPSGEKFGKTAEGTSIWLDPEVTSPYAFYQYWLNADDRDVRTYLRWFTLLGADEIEALEEEQDAGPESRVAQRTLALDLTARVHGREAAEGAAKRASDVFSGGLLSLDLDGFVAATADLPHVTISSSEVPTAAGTAVAAGVASSNGEARRLISQGGLYVNDVRISGPGQPLPEPIHGQFWVVRSGKKNIRIVERGT